MDRLDAINSIINTRSHDFRLFITHVDCNVRKNSFFICTALMWNLLLTDNSFDQISRSFIGTQLK